MSAPVQETRLSLLRDLSQIGGRGRAEHESVTRIREVFHPVAEHLRALDPEVVLIVGPRGAGKSQLFKAITDAGLVPAIARHAPSLQRLPSDPTKSKWLSGYRLPKRRRLPHRPPGGVAPRGIVCKCLDFQHLQRQDR